MRLSLLLAALWLSVTAFGASAETEIRSMMKRQFAAANRSDLNGYMATIAPGPSYDATKQGLSMAFKAYKLKFTLNSLKIQSVKGNVAHGRMVSTTARISGPAFKNNKVTSDNTFLRIKGKWLIADTKMVNIEYLK